jgi:hypothetical protein
MTTTKREARVRFLSFYVKRFGVFVSYSRKDDPWAAGRIKDCISRALGPRSVLRDTDSIRAGADFRKEIDAAVGQCKVMLALIGADWLDRSRTVGERRTDSENDWVRIEIEAALQRHRVVLPVLLDERRCPMRQRYRNLCASWRFFMPTPCGRAPSSGTSTALSINYEFTLPKRRSDTFSAN